MAEAAKEVDVPAPPATDCMDAVAAAPEQTADEPDQSTAAPLEKKVCMSGPEIKFKVTFLGKLHEVCLTTDTPVRVLKEHLQKTTEIPCNMQKLLWKSKGITDDTPLCDTGVKDGGKVMMVGCKVDDVFQLQSKEIEAASAPTSEQAASSAAAAKETAASKAAQQKIIDKGIPENAEKGEKGRQAPLPPGNVIQNVYNHRGEVARLTFKTDIEQLWIGSKQDTKKIDFKIVRGVSHEPIDSSEGYSIVSLQLGSTENHKYLLYYVPAQYVRAIQNCIMQGPYF
jgi:hypothetical protein